MFRNIFTYLFFFVSVSFFQDSLLFAASISSTSTGGNWSDGTTWVGGVPPTLNEDAIIVAGATVTIGKSGVTSVACKNLIIDGTLQGSATSCTLMIYGNFSRTGTYNRTNTSNLVDFEGTNCAIFNNAVFPNLKIGSSTTLTLNDYIQVSPNDGGKFTNNGTLNPNGYKVILGNNIATPNINITVDGTNAISFYDLEVRINTAKTVTLSQSIIVNNLLTLTTGTINNSTGQVFIANAGSIKRDQGSISNIPIFNGTVNIIYSNSGASDYNTGPELPTSTGNVLNNLTINCGNSARTVTLNYDVTVNGDVILTAGYFNGSSRTITAKGNWTNNNSSTAFTYSTSTVILSGSSKTIGGSSGTSFYNLTISIFAVYSLNPTGVSSPNERIKVFNNYTQNSSSTLSISSAKVLDLYGANILIAGNINATDVFDGTRDIDINNTATLSGGGTLNADFRIYAYATTLNSGIIVNGDFIINSNATNPASLNAGGYAITIAGNWSNSGTFNCGTSTVTFWGNTAQSIKGSSNTTFYNLTVDRTTTTALTVGNSSSAIATTVTNNFTWNGHNDRIVAGNYAGQIFSVPAITIPTGSELDGFNGSATLLVSTYFTNNGVFVRTNGLFAVEFSGPISSISGSNTVFGSLTIDNGCTLSLGTSIYCCGTSGNTATFTNNGILSAGGLNFNFGYPGSNTDQYIKGTSTTTFGPVTIYGQGSSGTTKLFQDILIGNSSVSSGFTISSGTLDCSSYTITDNIDWVNNSVFSCGTGTVIFGSTLSETISGTSTTTFYNMTLNKGSDINTVLNVTAPVVVSHVLINALSFTNGLLSINNGGSLTLPDADHTISSNSGLQVNGGTLNGGNYTFINNGTFKVISGTANIGNSTTGNSLYSQSGSTVYISGGTLNLTGRIKATGTASVTISGGTINLTTYAINSASDAAFDISSNASLNISSGTITLQNANAGASGDINISTGTGTKTCTGGTFQIGTSSTPVSQNFYIYNTGVQFYNLTIHGTNSPTATLSSNIQIGDNLDINSGGTLTVVNGANNYNITIARHWTNNGTFTCGTGTVTFNGASGASQEVRTGGSPFYNVIINHAGTSPFNDLVQFYSDATITNDLTITDGTLEGDGGASGRIITLNGNWINNSADDGFHRGEGTVILAGSSKSIGGTKYTVYHNLTNNGSYTLSQNIYITGYSTAGNITNNGTFDATTNHTTVFLGWNPSTYSQSVGAGSQPITFYNLTVLGSGTSGTSTLNQNITVTKDVLISSGTFDANRKNITVAGNWTNNAAFTHSSTAFDGNGYVEFNGSSAQSINGTSITTFYNLVMNNSSSGVTLNVSSNADRKVEFTSGILHTTSSNLIILNDTAFVTSGGSFGDSYAGKSTSFVDGPIKKIGRNRVQGGGSGSGSWHGAYGNEWTFTFPTGKSNKWAPVRLTHWSGTTATTDAFQAEYFKAGYGTYNVNSPLDHVSTVEYWTMDKISGNANLNKMIALFAKDLAFSYITNINDANLVVAHWNGSAWEDYGHFSNTSENIQSNTFTSFSPFTFGSKTPSNPLPVELLSFSAALHNDIIDITWSTASELNSDYFVVQRSADMNSSADIATVNAAGINNSTLNYAAVDEHPLTGVNYYRLKEVDYDGNTTYSDWVAVAYNPSQNVSSVNLVNIYPNPANGGNINVVFTSESQNINAELYDCQGKLLQKIIPSPSEISNSIIQINISDLPQGIYIVTISDGKTFSSQRFIKSE